MRKKTKITIDPKYILAVIAVVSILMIVVSFRFNDKGTGTVSSWRCDHTDAEGY